MQAEETLLAHVFVKVRGVEPALRRAMNEDLSRSIGPLWRSRLPNTLVTEFERRRTDDLDKGGGDRGPDLLEYATISELCDLIFRFWEVFEHRFGSRDFAIGEFQEFRVLRNSLMHGSLMTEEECERLSALADEIVRKSERETFQRDVRILVEGATSATADAAGEDNLSRPQQTLLEIVEPFMSEMSGVISGERKAILSFISSHLDESSYSLLARIKEKFVFLADTEDVVGKVMEKVPPRRPRAPREGWSETNWLSWATREYIPYRSWVISQRREDEELDSFRASYEDWLFDAYPGLLKASKDMLVENAFRQVKHWLDKDANVFWLVVDNLAGFWFPEFREAIENAGVKVEDYRRMLAMLPSTSDVSRRSLLAGRAPKYAMQFRDDATACAQLWGEQGIDSLSFCRTLEEVDQAIEVGRELIVFLFNRLDRLAHDPEEPGFDRKEEMIRVMESLARSIGRRMRLMNDVKETKLVVTTDHGAIWPSPWSQVISMPPSVADQEGIEQHNRYCLLEEAQGLSPVDWHVLDREQFMLPSKYAVAKGERFIDAQPRGYTHGGLSPEETAVSLLVGSISRREDLELAFFFRGKPIRLGRPASISILVRNPFGMPVESLEMMIPDSQITFDRMDLPPVSEQISNEVEIALPSETQVSDDIAYLRLDYEYVLAGARQLETSQLRVDVARLYKSSIDDFQGLFDG